MNDGTDLFDMKGKALAKRGCIASAALSILLAAAAGQAHAEQTSREVMCGFVDQAARVHSLPSSFLTRLLWRESSFRTGARSGAGAQGIAQFMPSTARERGLTDPFDAETAIPASASYVAELRHRFGSLDLAAAAYNAGPNRIARWRAGKDELPEETRAHVRFITGASLNEKREMSGGLDWEKLSHDSCMTTLASLRTQKSVQAGDEFSQVLAPWAIQLISRSSKDDALREFEALRRRYASVLAGQQPTILATRLGGRGGNSNYRIRIGFQRKPQADSFCRELRRVGGSCLTVRN